MISRVAAAALAVLCAGCVSFGDAPPSRVAPAIDGDAIIAADGARLGATRWRAENPQAVIVGVHGMNDYANAFHYAGPDWAAAGIEVIAYDQRGFGRSGEPGRWAGSAAMKQDLRNVIAAAHAAFPGKPVYVVGHSMGAAVILAAMKEAPLDVDGVVLAAPGVWGGKSMPILYRSTLNFAAMLAPGKTLTGERAGRQASDNIEFLRAMYDDPLVIKATRLDAILGAERIMGEGYAAAAGVEGNLLLIYGAKDDIIPVKAILKTAGRLCGGALAVSYPASWHMIFADHQRAAPIGDVASWIMAGRDGQKEWRPQDRMGNPGVTVSTCTGSRGIDRG